MVYTDRRRLTLTDRPVRHSAESSALSSGTVLAVPVATATNEPLELTVSTCTMSGRDELFMKILRYTQIYLIERENVIICVTIVSV